MGSDKKPVIQIKDLYKTFREGFFRQQKNAVEGLSLEVHEGEIFGFLGPNGAGKTTTIKVLMGLLFPTRGSTRIFGVSSRDVQARSRVGFLPENPYFYDYLTGYESLDFYARLFGLSRSVRPARVERLLEQVGMLPFRDRPLRKYSKGMTQRIGIAQALVNDPDLVILDEPMSGLDPIGRKEVRDIIFQLKEQGKTVFFSSHILQDVEMICDRVAILHERKLRRIGPLDELLQEQQDHEVELTVTGLRAVSQNQLKAMATQVLSPGERLTVVLPRNKQDEACQLVMKEGGRIEALVPHKGTLEELFVQEVHQSAEESSQ